MIIVVGGLTDAGGYTINLVTGERKPIPGWEAGAMLELGSALAIIREAAQLKTPGLAEAVIKDVGGFVQKELEAHTQRGDVVVIGRPSA